MLLPEKVQRAILYFHIPMMKETLKKKKKKHCQRSYSYQVSKPFLETS